MKGLQCNLTEEQLTTIYSLLYSYYGNDIVASSDINRFKFKLFSLIYQNGPVWAKKIQLRDNMIALTDDEIVQGDLNINNVSTNPSTIPETDSDVLLTTINQQVTNKHKKSKINAYSDYYNMLENDPTESFVKKFKNLFLIFVAPENSTMYSSTGMSNLYFGYKEDYLYGSYRNKSFSDVYPDFEKFYEDYLS